MKNGELIQEGTEAELTEKVKCHVWKCQVGRKYAGMERRELFK